MVERHIWALGKNLDQWEGPPEEAEGEDEEDKEDKEYKEDKEDKVDKEDKEEIEEEGRVKLNCQTQASKYTK